MDASRSINAPSRSSLSLQPRLILPSAATTFPATGFSRHRYTLVDQPASPLIAAAARRGMGFVNAAPFGGGILMRRPQGQPKYSYAPASAAILDRIDRMDRLCQEHDVPLAALALQFSLGLAYFTRWVPDALEQAPHWSAEAVKRLLHASKTTSSDAVFAIIGR